MSPVIAAALAPGADAILPNPRFLDVRLDYLEHVKYLLEKRVIGAFMALAALEICARLPAEQPMRVFDAGVGEGSVLNRTLRALHDGYPDKPILVVGKEYSGEDVNFALEKLIDRFQEHPDLVVVMTNMFYKEAPTLTLNRKNLNTPVTWKPVLLTGTTSLAFEDQIHGLASFVTEQWASVNTPTVLVIAREDRADKLKNLIPQPGQPLPGHNMIICSQPYRLMGDEKDNDGDPVKDRQNKINTIIAPLARSLLPGGRLVGAHSIGGDISEDITHTLWPDHNFFPHRGEDMIEAALKVLNKDAAHPEFFGLGSQRLSYGFTDSVLKDKGDLGVDFVTRLWRSANYIAQTPPELKQAAEAEGIHLAAVRSALSLRQEATFNDTTYTIARGPN